MSSAMSDWSKIVDPKKLVLGVSSDGIIELTLPTDQDLSVNGTVPRDVNATIPNSVFGQNVNTHNYIKPYIDRCTFKEDVSLRVVSCLGIRSTGSPLNNSCTA